MPSHTHIAIIGAGPCGLMAAETLAKAGHNVTIYDRMPSPARKLLIAGRGGLNLTHSEPLEKFLTRYGSAADWLAPSIRAFTPDDLRAWCQSLGQETFIGTSGRVFPTSMKAVELLRAWLQRLETLGVHYAPRHTWHGWQGETLHFTNASQQDALIKADATLLALGGASWPRLGSDGVWTRILAQQGISIAPLRPANSGFTVNWSPYFAERFAGQPLKPVTLMHQAMAHQGEAMITARGIEGGAIYAISRHLRTAIEQAGCTPLRLDLRPNMSTDALAKKLGTRGSQSFSTYLKKGGLSPLLSALLREVESAEALAQMDAQQLAARIKSLPITLTGTTGIERAISSAGGIARSELSDDFMLKAKPGLFAAGEMLDWEAPTGGYLLQACYSTAVAAAQGITNYLA